MADESGRLQLKWRSGLLGCLLPVLVFGAGLFGLAAIRPVLASELGDERRGAWIRITEAVSVGGVNLPLAALALYLAFEAFRFAWRWADEDAVWADATGLHFHGSLFRRSLGWDELRSVAARPRWRGRRQIVVLAVETREGRTIEVAGVAEADAERFAAALSERLGRQ